MARTYDARYYIRDSVPSQVRHNTVVGGPGLSAIVDSQNGDTPVFFMLSRDRWTREGSDMIRYLCTMLNARPPKPPESPKAQPPRSISEEYPTMWDSQEYKDMKDADPDRDGEGWQDMEDDVDEGNNTG